MVFTVDQREYVQGVFWEIYWNSMFDVIILSVSFGVGFLAEQFYQNREIWKK